MEYFILKALMAGIFIAIIAGPMGSIVVWKKMAFFGDALSHSALLAIAIGFILGINTQLSIFIICGLISLIVVMMQKNKLLSNDSLLGIISHSALAIGLVIIYMVENIRLNLLT